MAFPATPLDVAVELWVDSRWVDITSDVRTGSPGGPITITRGSSDWGRAIEPTTCDLTVNNRDSKYSPRNPNSPYYGLIGRNTPLRVKINDFIADTFTRTTSNGWGTANTGQVWSVSGTASEYATTGTAATITFNAVNSSRYTWLAGRLRDTDVTASFSTNELATGAAQACGLTARYQADGEHYLMWLKLNIDQVVQIELWHHTATTSAFLATATLGFAHAINTPIRLRFAIAGNTMKGKAWLASTAEPDTWDIEDTHNLLGLAGKVGVRARTDTGNTNGSMVFTVDDLTADDVRFAGEVSQWPPRSDVTGRDVWAPLQASGILRRLQQGASPLRSQLRRGLEWQDPVVYWPMEDGEGATSFASSSPGGPGLVFNTSIDPGAGSGSGIGGSLPLAVIGAGGTLRGTVPMGTTTGWTVQLVANVAFSNSSNADLLRWKTPGGTPAWWRIQMQTGSPTAISIQGLDADRVALAAFDGVVLFIGAADGSSAEDRWLILTVTAAQSGGNIVYSIEWNFSEDSEGTQGFSYTDAGTLAPITAIDVGPYLSHVEGTTIGHLAIWDHDSGGLFGRDDADYMGAVSEPAGDRIERLCEEESVPCLIVGDASLTAAVGPQGVSSLITLLQDAADVDDGILHETRGLNGVAFRTSRSLLNQHLDPMISLDFAANELAPPFEPVEDDQALRNDVTVSRRDGSSGRRVITSGPLSTLDPPDGVGVYDEALTLNAFSDSQLDDLASWRAHVGTCDEPRVPVVRVNLAQSQLVADPTLAASVAAADLGDCISVSNVPAWLGPDTVELMIRGYTETLAQFTRAFSFNTTPFAPWRVFEVEHADLGAVDTSGSSLATSNLSARADANGTTTTIVVADLAAVGFSIGNDCRIYDIHGLLKHDQTVEITNMASGFGFTVITFSPAVDEATVGTFGGDGDFIRRVDQTSLSVAFDVAGDHWSTTAADFDIEIGGERMTVTAVSGTTSPQTFTVTRSVNGIQKAHTSGTPVRLWRPGALPVS